MVGDDEEARVVVHDDRSFELRVDERLLARDKFLHLVECRLVTCERRLLKNGKKLAQHGPLKSPRIIR